MTDIVFRRHYYAGRKLMTKFGRRCSMSYFDKYVSVHFSYSEETISGWSDLNSRQRLMMSLKILTDSFGVLMILVIISELIN